MNIEKVSNTIDSIQSGLVWFVIALITVCIGVLLTFDVLAGTGTMLFLTGNKEWQSVVISLATTGLLFALMFIGYMLITKTRNRMINSIGRGVMAISAVLYVTDIVFDSLLADILRYGVITEGVDWLQWAFRGIIGGISTVGDGLAIAMIVGMPVLKTILREALGDETIPQKESRNGQTRQTPSQEISPAVQRIQQSQGQRPQPRPQPAQAQYGNEPTYRPVSMESVKRVTPPSEQDLPAFIQKRNGNNYG